VIEVTSKPNLGRVQNSFALQDCDRIENATSASAGFALPAQAVQTNDANVTGTALAAAATLPTGPELAALLAELAKLSAAASQLVASAQRPAVPQAPRPPQLASATPAPARGYCWTHGSTANGTHTSATCRNKAPGHVDTATWRNKQGGNKTAYVPPSRRPTTPDA
jgi:hypothetical protein